MSKMDIKHINKNEIVTLVTHQRLAISGCQVTIECTNISAIVCKDPLEILLKLAGAKSIKWHDTFGRTQEGGSLAWNLLCCLRDILSWPVIYLWLCIRIHDFKKDLPGYKAKISRLSSVLFLRTDHWFNISTGGSVGHLRGVINGFKTLDLKVHIVATDHLTGVPEDDNFHLCYPLYSLGSNIPNLPEMLYSSQLVRYISQSWSNWQPDFIYQRYSLGNYTGVILKRIYNIPYICEYNGSFIWMAKHWEKRILINHNLLNKIETLNLQAADLVIVVSQASYDELVNRGVNPEKILVNPNGIDPQQYRPDIAGTAIREKLNLGGKIVVGFIGTFGRWHGAEELAKAVKLVVAKCKNIHFLFIGEGATLSEVRSIIEDDRMSSFVTFTGLVPQAEGPSYLAACDILAAPHVPNPDGTPFFGSPTKLFEYMAMNKAIVASRLEQIAEVLQNEINALLVPPQDPRALAEAIVKLSDNPALRERLGQQGREDVVRKYTWDINVSRVIDKLKTICSKN